MKFCRRSCRTQTRKGFPIKINDLLPSAQEFVAHFHTLAGVDPKYTNLKIDKHSCETAAAWLKGVGRG